LILADHRIPGLCFGLLLDTTILIGLTQQEFQASYFKGYDVRAHMISVTEHLEYAQRTLLGLHEFRTIHGENSQYDKINLADNCENIDLNLIESYSCLGLNKCYGYAISLSQSILESPPSFDFSNKSLWFQINQLMSRYIMLSQRQSNKIASQMFVDSSDSYSRIIILITFAEIFLYCCVLRLFFLKFLFLMFIFKELCNC
jgi:hypothetical protein